MAKVSEQWDADIKPQGQSALFVRTATPRPYGTENARYPTLL